MFAKFHHKIMVSGVLLCIYLSVTPIVTAQETQPEKSGNSLYPVAILPFTERNVKNSENGKIVSDILFANIVVDPLILLVDREDLDKVLDEQGLNISGAVDPKQAAQVGQIIGAKILVTGSVFKAGNSQYIVAKVIGTETTRVFGASVKGNEKEELNIMAEKLSTEVTKLITTEGEKLVAKPLTQQNRIARLNEMFGDKKRPILSISIAEEHTGRRTIDPAAETEMTLFALESGCEVLDSKNTQSKEPEFIIKGEAFSEYAATHGKLMSVKARVEIKVIDPKTGKIVATDHQTTVAVDLTEQIAAKTALQQAGAILAERVLPKLVELTPKKP